MTTYFLLKAICEFLRETIEEYAASQNKKSKYVTPRVFESYLPFRKGRSEEEIDFPYIVARISNGEDSENDSTVNVFFFFGVYCEGEENNGFVQPDGVYDLMNLMEHIRIALFRQVLLDQRFEIQKPYKWEIPDEQPYPLWVGWAMSKWSVPMPLQQIEGSFLHG